MRVDSWDLIGGSSITNSRVKIYKASVQQCSACKIYSRCRRKRLAGFGASQGGNLPRPENQEPLHMLSLFVVLHTCWTQRNVLSTFNQSTLEELPPRPLRLASFITEHCEPGPCHVQRNLGDGLVDFHGRGQGLAE